MRIGERLGGMRIGGDGRNEDWGDGWNEDWGDGWNEDWERWVE